MYASRAFRVTKWRRDLDTLKVRFVLRGKETRDKCFNERDYRVFVPELRELLNYCCTPNSVKEFIACLRTTYRVSR